MFKNFFDFLSGKKTNGTQTKQSDAPYQPPTYVRKPTPLWIQIFNTVFPTLCAVAYILIGIFLHLWHPTWLLFLLVPLYYSLTEAVRRKDATYFAFPVLVVGVYLLLGFLKVKYFLWFLPILISIPIYYLICSAIKRKNIILALDGLVPILCVIGYLCLGLIGGWWHPGWVIFFAIPLYYQTVAAVKKYQKEKRAANYGKPEHSGYSKVETMTEEEYEERRKS